MKSYIVKKVNHAFRWCDIEVGKVNVYNWKEFQGYDPEAEFQMAHDDNNIFLRLTAHNDFNINECTEVNQFVCNDSCMEAFFNLPGMVKTAYFNFEFNANGVIFLGWGESRENRITVDPAIIKKYITIMAYGNDIPKTERGEWSITVIINKELFPVLTGFEFTGGECGGNFYKCGEHAISHFISWDEIIMDHPDFHRPEYFGKLIFE